MIYVCETCGKWGGLGLALARPFENLAKALKGEQVGLVDPDKVFCPDCNIEMRQVTENDRLHVLDAVMEVKKEGMHE
jgi:Zn finger protein HypA/HybF involved in hydrogenase expression